MALYIYSLLFTSTRLSQKPPRVSVKQNLFYGLDVFFHLFRCATSKYGKNPARQCFLIWTLRRESILPGPQETNTQEERRDRTCFRLQSWTDTNLQVLTVWRLQLSLWTPGAFSFLPVQPASTNTKFRRQRSRLMTPIKRRQPHFGATLKVLVFKTPGDGLISFCSAWWRN